MGELRWQTLPFTIQYSHIAAVRIICLAATTPVTSITYLLVATSWYIGIVPGRNPRRSLDVQFLGLNFDVATAWLVGGILQGSNLGSNHLQIRRWCRPNLHFIHRYCNIKKSEEIKIITGTIDTRNGRTFLGFHGCLWSLGQQP